MLKVKLIPLQTPGDLLLGHQKAIHSPPGTLKPGPREPDQ